jgi:hypothetical protein
MTDVGIVLAYGVFLPPNPLYQQYLDQALKLLLTSAPHLIITCGGHTNQNYPHLSEADTIAGYFLQKAPGLKSHIQAEISSLTTVQNLSNACRLIRTSKIVSPRLTIVCDSIRVPKVFYLSLQIFKSLLPSNLTKKDRLQILLDIYLNQPPDLIRPLKYDFHNLTVLGVPYSKSAQLASHQVMSSMLEMHALDYPDLHEQFVNWRKNKWGIRSPNLHIKN